MKSKKKLGGLAETKVCHLKVLTRSFLTAHVRVPASPLPSPSTKSKSSKKSMTKGEKSNELLEEIETKFKLSHTADEVFTIRWNLI